MQGNVKVTGTLTQASSIALKENVSELSGQEAMSPSCPWERLSAVKFHYKADTKKEQRLGFIAEDVPALVATAERDCLSPMDLIAVLTRALQEQQQTITALAAKVDTLVCPAPEADTYEVAPAGCVAWRHTRSTQQRCACAPYSWGARAENMRMMIVSSYEPGGKAVGGETSAASSWLWEKRY